MQSLEEQKTELERDISTIEEITIQLSWVSHRRLEQDLDEYNLTMPQYMALRCIEELEKGCSMKRLAELSYQVSATMTGIVDRLVDRGLVTREREPHDRRSLRVALSPEGKDLLVKVNAHKKSWLGKFLEHLSAEERKTMVAMADRYLEIVKSMMNNGQDAV